MIKRVLVPLDGSHLAEQALKVAADIAEAAGGAVVVARVVTPPLPGRFYAANLLDQLREGQQKEAEAYLTSVAERLREDRVAVETRVAYGPAAETLVAMAERERCDIVAMSSHGLGGIGWQVFGSVAQKVLHSSRCPVLIVPTTEAEFAREEEEEEGRADSALLGELAQQRETPAAS